MTFRSWLQLLAAIVNNRNKSAYGDSVLIKNMKNVLEGIARVQVLDTSDVGGSQAHIPN